MINPASPFNPNSVTNSPGSYSAWLNSRMNPSDPKSILTPQEAAPDLFKYGEMLGVYKPSASESSRMSSEEPRESSLSQKSWNSTAQKSFSEAASTAGRDAAASVRSQFNKPANPFILSPDSQSSNGLARPQTTSSELGQNSQAPFPPDNSQNPLPQQNRTQPNKNGRKWEKMGSENFFS